MLFVDYRASNKVTIPHRFLILIISKMLNKLHRDNISLQIGFKIRLSSNLSQNQRFPRPPSALTPASMNL